MDHGDSSRVVSKDSSQHTVQVLETGFLDFRSILELSKNTDVSKHPETLEHHATLAILNWKRRDFGNFDVAVRIGAYVLSKSEEFLGEEHRKTIGRMSAQATYLIEADQECQSKSLIDRAVRLAASI